MILNSTSVAEVFGRIDHKSNIYASKGMWDGENRIHDMLKSKGLRKAPGGGSWIEIWQRVHMILSSKSHPQMKRFWKS
jgi:hypothetical protein